MRKGGIRGKNCVLFAINNPIDELGSTGAVAALNDGSHIAA
jgi:hypothetical protein